MQNPPGQMALAALNYESLYFNNLEMLMFRFVQPLKKWGLIDPADLKTMFQYVGELYKVTKIHIDTLGKSVNLMPNNTAGPEDNTQIVEDLVAMFTNPGLLELYSNYNDTFADIEKTVERCKLQHERFWAFVNGQERGSQSNLSDLQRQPLLHIIIYADIVRKLLAFVPPNHGMRKKIETASDSWVTLHERVDFEQKIQNNAEKLASIELSFPHDRLELTQTRSDEDEPKKRNTKRITSKFVYSKALSEVENEYAKCASSEYHIVYQMKPNGPRFYIQEDDAFDGPEKEGRKRRVFILHDVVLIAKPRTKGTYTLKRRLKLSESWIGESPEMDSNHSLVLGSPYHRQGVLSFGSANRKRRFAETLRRLLDSAKDSDPQNAGEISVFPFLGESVLDGQSSGLPKFQTIQAKLHDSAADVIVSVLKQIGVNPTPDEYRMYELTTHGLLAVSAWECPLAINRVGSRCLLHRSHCQYVIRPATATPLVVEELPAALQCLITHASTKPQRRVSESSVPQGRILTTAEQLDQFNREKKKGMLKAFTSQLKTKLGLGGISGKLPDNHYTATKPQQGQLYGRPLDDLFANGELPKPLQHMISRLYYDGPDAVGLFRKSANARVCRQVRERLDAGQDVNFADLQVLAVGAVLKEFLRSLPDSVMTLDLYDEMVAINSIKSVSSKIDFVLQVLKKLPASNRYLLGALMPVFVQICKANNTNNMTAMNVGICIGQSLMWPRTTEDILKNDVPPFIEFMIQHFDALFGAANAHVIFDKLTPAPDKQIAQELTDDGNVSDN